MIQIVATSSRASADGLRDKLRASGLSSYVESVKTADGEMHRVRVGPFSSRSQAEAAQGRLKSLPGGGYNGSLIPL